MLASVKPSPGLPPATAIVRTLLAKHGPLHTIQLYRLGLDQFPSESVINPPEAPTTVAVRSDGQTRFVGVSNKKGGSRLFIPKPEPPHPDHPFMSVHYMKRNVLHSLEDQSLIRKVRVEVPITDMSSPEAAEAIAAAEKINRRRQRAAAMALPTVGSHYRKRGAAYHDWEEKVYNLEVEKVEPKFTRTEYVWELVGPEMSNGKERERTTNEDEERSDATPADEASPIRSLEDMTDMARPGSSHSSIIDHPLVKSRWAIADSKDSASRRLMQMNLDRAWERKARRREGYDWEKDQKDRTLAIQGKTVEERRREKQEREREVEREEREAAQKRFARLRPRVVNSARMESRI